MTGERHERRDDGDPRRDPDFDGEDNVVLYAIIDNDGKRVGDFHTDCDIAETLRDEMPEWHLLRIAEVGAVVSARRVTVVSDPVAAGFEEAGDIPPSFQMAVGRKVKIINRRSVTGTFFHEGTATIVEVLENHGNGDYTALVRFPEDKEGVPVRRFIDASGQGDPRKYCAGLNDAASSVMAGDLDAEHERRQMGVSAL